MKDLVDAQQFHFEHQGGVRRDHAAGTARPVGQFRRDGELALAADLHAGHALVPAGDALAHAELEFEGVVAVDAGVEFLAVGEPAGVVHRHVLAGAGGVAAAGDEVFDDEFAHDSVLECEIAMGAQATVLREAAHFLTFPGQRHSAGRYPVSGSTSRGMSMTLLASGGVLRSTTCGMPSTTATMISWMTRKGIAPR